MHVGPGFSFVIYAVVIAGFTTSHGFRIAMAFFPFMLLSRW